jgi:hypothetical protein
MGEFTRDPSHWLRRLSPEEWIRAALGELERAAAAYDRGDSRAGVVGVKRAAGMAAEPSVPEAVRAASRAVLGAKAPSGSLVSLRTPRTDERALEAARDVIAHAWAVVKRHE